MITGVGVDLVSISRLSRLLSKVSSLEKNIFSLRERDLPIRSKAGNVAVKEAMVKAGLLNGFKSFSDIEVLRETDGAPKVVKENQAIKSPTEECVDICISISYMDDIAMALVVCQKIVCNIVDQ